MKKLAMVVLFTLLLLNLFSSPATAQEWHKFDLTCTQEVYQLAPYMSGRLLPSSSNLFSRKTVSEERTFIFKHSTCLSFTDCVVEGLSFEGEVLDIRDEILLLGTKDMYTNKTWDGRKLNVYHTQFYNLRTRKRITSGELWLTSSTTPKIKEVKSYDHGIIVTIETSEGQKEIYRAHGSGMDLYLWKQTILPENVESVFDEPERSVWIHLGKGKQGQQELVDKLCQAWDDLEPPQTCKCTWEGILELNPDLQPGISQITITEGCARPADG